MIKMFDKRPSGFVFPGPSRSTAIAMPWSKNLKNKSRQRCLPA